MQDKSSTLDLLLTYAINTHLNSTEHARRIRKCAKSISQHTKDKPLRRACRALRGQKNNELVVQGVQKAYLVMFPDPTDQ